MALRLRPFQRGVGDSRGVQLMIGVIRSPRMTLAMTTTALQKEIAAFERNVVRYRQSWGPAWVVVVGGEARGHFSKFDAAAQFAIDTFPDAEFLIRHTDPEPEFIPLIAVS